MKYKFLTRISCAELRMENVRMRQMQRQLLGSLVFGDRLRGYNDIRRRIAEARLYVRGGKVQGTSGKEQKGTKRGAFHISSFSHLCRQIVD